MSVGAEARSLALKNGPLAVSGLRDAEAEPSAGPARVLVVDDDRITRAKLRLAARSLGHEAEEAATGAAALARLAQGRIDAVLLDIVMPEMDGYAVLRAMKADADLRDVPVIVVSGLEDDTASVVRAIELGAEDFLPKAFESAILKARLDASLRKKRYRDREREQARVLGRLIEAAETVEQVSFRPGALGLDDLVARGDALGRFARVFQGMALEIHARESRLRRRVRALNGALLVIAIGVAFGATTPLARVASQLDASPLGLAVWNNAVGAALLLGLAAAQGRLRRPTQGEAVFFLAWGLLNAAVLELTQLWVAAHVPAATVSLILTLRGFMTLVVAAAFGLEQLQMRRVAGLGLGLAATALVFLSRESLSAGESVAWLLAAALLPLLMVVEATLIAAFRPKTLDPLPAVGIVHAIGLAAVLPFAAMRGDWLVLGPTLGPLELAVGAMAIMAALSTLLAVHLVLLAGPVFASQAAYTSALAGIIWSMLLLGEGLPLVAWGALALMFLGLYFVTPRENDEDVSFRLPIALRGQEGAP